MVDSSILERYSLFGGLDRDQINRVVALMEQEFHKASSVIITEGKQNDKIRFILDGKVAVVKGGIILAEFNEGALFGEMEVLDIMPAEASVRAVIDTSTLSLSGAALREIYNTDIKAYALMLMNLARDISRRLRRMDNMVTQESPFMEWN